MSGIIPMDETIPRSEKVTRAILSFLFFFVSKSNLKIHRTQLPLIKFRIRDVFDGLRFSSIFASVNIEKKKIKK